MRQGALLRAKLHFLRKSPKMVKFHDFNENGWNSAKMALFREKGARGDRILGPGLSVTDGESGYAGSVQHRHARAGWRPLRNEVPFGGGLRPPLTPTILWEPKDI